MNRYGNEKEITDDLASFLQLDKASRIILFEGYE